jgi:hypothetical protein
MENLVKRVSEIWWRRAGHGAAAAGVAQQADHASFGTEQFIPYGSVHYQLKNSLIHDF